MCFNKTEESKLLIAKRDITVYKVGCFADEVRFYSYFMTTYMYSRDTPMRECVDFNREGSQYPFRCIGFSRKYCIPYEGNEYLLGTRNNPE